MHTRLEAGEELASRLRLFALLAPHLEVGGWGNNGNVVETTSGAVLTAHKGGTWLALAATVPFVRCSCGYVGTTDGWQDLMQNFQMDWEFDCAPDGNIALMGELDIRQSPEFVLGLAFGESLHNVLVTLSQALAIPFDDQCARFIQQWQSACKHLMPVRKKVTGDGNQLYSGSHGLILAHEDKLYDGAIIASLSIPWGEFMGDEDLGGYHLVWTRDMCHSASALLASGDAVTPRRALIYLACSQRPDGGFYQNFWINGDPFWSGVQLDEVALPVLLAWRLREAKALENFDPYPMVLKAASYLIDRGPVTPQERWEESSGYSPSTLASHIAALISAAAFAADRGDRATAEYLREYADFLECHIEPWTVTTQGTLVAGVPRHYIRINPVDVNDSHADEDPNRKVLALKNQPPGARTEYPAKEIVDTGFLELVRYGIRSPGDALIEDSLRVVDAVLKVDLPAGPCWHRYNHDGYGQREDGGPYQGWGHGRAWPLLIGERGHYELAAGRDVSPFLRALEGFATSTGLIPEQVWDEPDRPDIHMFRGRPTGGAMPLLWAHAEYIKLVRSAVEGRIIDLVPEVAARYHQRRACKPLEVWKFNRQVRAMQAGRRLRIQVSAAFRLHWTLTEWQQVHDTLSTPTMLGVEFVDIAVPQQQRAPIRFTFFWTAAEHWEGRDYEVAME
jgi:glucoamylase